MKKQELTAKLADLEWEDFEVKEAKANVLKIRGKQLAPFQILLGVG